MEYLILLGIPMVATAIALLLTKSRWIAVACAIVLSEVAFLAFLAQDHSGWGLAIFLGFSPIVIGACLLVAAIANIFSTFSARDRVTLVAAAILHLAITNLVFEWSYRWHDSEIMNAAFAQKPIPSPPIGLELVDGVKIVFSVPVIWGISVLFHEPLQNFPTGRFLILATINSLFVAYGCVFAARWLSRRGAP